MPPKYRIMKAFGYTSELWCGYTALIRFMNELIFVSEPKILQPKVRYSDKRNQQFSAVSECPKDGWTLWAVVWPEWVLHACKLDPLVHSIQAKCPRVSDDDDHAGKIQWLQQCGTCRNSIWGLCCHHIPAEQASVPLCSSCTGSKLVDISCLEWVIGEGKVERQM